MNAPVVNNDSVADRVKEVAVFEPGMGSYNFGQLGEAVKFADLMSHSGPMLPEFARGQPAICLGLVMRATHWGFDPYALAMEAYQPAQGGPVGYQSKVFVAALQNVAGIQLKYRFEGEVTYTGKPALSSKGKQIAPNEASGDRVCIAYAEINGELLEMRSPPLSAIHPKNSALWHTKPDLQQSYYTGRDWVRLYRPGVILGALSTEEADDYGEMKDVTPKQAAKPVSFAERAAQVREQNATTLGGSPASQGSTPADAQSSGAEPVDEGKAGTDDPAPHDQTQHTEAFKEGELTRQLGQPITAYPKEYTDDQIAAFEQGWKSWNEADEETKE